MQERGTDGGGNREREKIKEGKEGKEGEWKEEEKEEGKKTDSGKTAFPQGILCKGEIGGKKERVREEKGHKRGRKERDMEGKDRKEKKKKGKKIKKNT